MSRFVPSSSRSDHIQLKRVCCYDVFVSFRGSNTRKTFTDHLLEDLKHNGYHSFHDSMLARGKYVDSELLKAIESSRMSIILFSKNYADSKWCLDELVHIMYCRKYFHHIVLPVFLDVEPSVVRKHKGFFAKSFESFEKHMNHMDQNRVQNWRKALKDAGRLSGLHLENDANGYEAKLVNKIVEEVAKYLKRPCHNVAYHPVGIESRVTKLIKLLQLETDDVRIVAVWGGGGLGKTTIAKATYNCIFSEFGNSSFLEDIKDSEKATLQNKLLVDLMTDKTPRINNVHHATEEISRILTFQRVLLVLDDISHFEQLEMLAIHRHFFIPGSRIIITTRDIASAGSLKMDAIYSPNALNKLESLKLFSLYAFGKDHPHIGYEVITKEVVQYAGGFPLVLKTIASSSSKLSKSEWQDNLRKLKKVPNDDVQGKLKVSFESLGYEEKEIYLNICCFFIGMEKDLMVKVMEDSNCFPEIDSKRLIDKALVNIDSGVISMHNLIRDMGREIVRQESLKEPGERSRLWDRDDISEVFRQCSGTSSVQSIYSNQLHHESVNIEAFEKMTNLTMLVLSCVCLYGAYKHMHSFKKLKYLQWHEFPMDYMPSKLIMRNLVVMDMQYSKLKILWKDTMNMENLRFLNLSNSYFLTTTPDFSGMKGLEKLLLAWCSKLVKLHSSVTCLDKLCILDLSYCVRLKSTPKLVCILKLISLKELYIYHCPKLKKNKDTSTPQYATISPLTKLSLAECNLSLVPFEIEMLKSLITLELHENEFTSLPELRNLNCLKQLTLSSCVMLQSIPDLPRNIVMLIAEKCISLKTQPSNMSNLHCLAELRLGGCEKLGSEDPLFLENLIGLSSLGFLDLQSCNVAHVPIEIGNLGSLTFLNLGGNNFVSVPPTLRNLLHLMHLDLSDCIDLQTVQFLPRNLKSFKAKNCKCLINMPSNMSDLKSLRELHLDGCSKLGSEDPFCFGKLEGLSNLVYLNMKNCNLSHIPYEIEGLVSLSRLNLSENTFSSLPASLASLQKLKEIELNACVRLKSFPVLPPDFTELKADNCRSLEVLPFRPFFLHRSSQDLRFSHCPEEVGNHYANHFKRYILQFHHELYQFQKVWPFIPEIRVSLTGTTIPDWCTYQGSSKFLSFVVPKDVKKFSGWIYCAIAPNCKDDECQLKCKVVNKTKGRADYIGTPLCGYGPMFIAFVPHLIDLIPRLTFMVEGGDELVLVFELGCKNDWEVQKCGLCLMYEGDDSILDSNNQILVQYTTSDLRQHLHQMVYEEKWEEFHEVYQRCITSKADDDSDAGGGDNDDVGVDHVSSDTGGGGGVGDAVGENGAGVEDAGAGYEQSYNGLSEGAPWFLLRPEEIGDWLHDDPMGS